MQDEMDVPRSLDCVKKGDDRDNKRLECSERQQQESDQLELPCHVWEHILCWLPMRCLFRMRSVCKAWKSMLDSKSFLTVYKNVPPQDVLLVLFADYAQRTVAAYNPLENRWVVIPFYATSTCSSSPGQCSFRGGVVSNKGLLIVESNRKGVFIVSNIFTKSHRCLPPLSPSKSTYVVALVVNSETSPDYKLVAVTTDDVLSSQVYSSANSSWKVSGGFDGRFAVLDTAVYLDGFLFCLAHGPHCLLAFDLEAESWHLVEVSLPSVTSSHLFEHEGSLILVGAIEESGVMKGIGIWELDEFVNQWRKLCEMPSHLFSRLSHGDLNFHFYSAGLWGKICFYRSRMPVSFMYDLSEDKWWVTPPCPYDQRVCRPALFGLALEPRLDAAV